MELIGRRFGHIRITDVIARHEALTPDQHEGSGFDELIRRIQAQLGV